MIQNENLLQSEQFLLVARALQNLGDSSLKQYQERRHQRIPRSLSVSVQPLNEDFQPDGEPFWLVSRDISLTGIGLISLDPIVHRHVRLGLLDENVSVIGEVRHNSSIGTHHPLYLVGVEFIT
jgi:hypothetical protein